LHDTDRRLIVRFRREAIFHTLFAFGVGLGIAICRKSTYSGAMSFYTLDVGPGIARRSLP
jgi:hypothetical protein